MFPDISGYHQKRLMVDISTGPPSELMLVGHSLGTQLVTRIADALAQRRTFVPASVVLLDPYMFAGTAWVCNCVLGYLL